MIKFYYDSSCGALVCSEAIDFANYGIITTLIDVVDRKSYGGAYLVGKSMNKACAKMVCKLLNGLWSEKKLI